MLSLYPKKDWFVLSILLLILLICRLPYLANSPLEYHGWRQSDTEAMARNFLTDKFNMFYPQLNYDGPGPNYAQLELQITTFLIAVLYRLFGYSYILARLVPLAFFLGSALFLYLIAQRLFNLRTAVLALILYGFLPYNIFFSRAIMPESAALFFFVGAFYLFIRWIENEEGGYFGGAAIFTALAITQKIPTVFIGIPFCYMLYKKYGPTALVKGQTWLFAFIALGLPILYFGWLQGVAKTDYVSGIAARQVLPNMGAALFSQDNLLFFYQILPKAFTGYGLGLALAGLLLVRGRGMPAALWFLAMILEQFIIVGAIRLEYYVLLLGPPLALLGGRSLDIISGRIKGGYLVGAILVPLITYHGIACIAPYFQEDIELLGQAELISKHTSTGDLIVTGQYNPCLLNMSHRKGWRANLIFPQSPQAEINYFAANGARFFVIVGDAIEGDEEGNYQEYVEKNLSKVFEDEALKIYRFKLLSD